MVVEELKGKMVIHSRKAARDTKWEDARVVISLLVPGLVAATSTTLGTYTEALVTSSTGQDFPRLSTPDSTTGTQGSE